MKRSTSVTVAGALLIAGGIFVGFGAVMGALGQIMMRSVSLPNLPKSDIPLVATLITFGLEATCAAWAIVTAIGIFRLRRWAWVSMLVLSGVMTLFAGFALTGMIIALPLIKTMPPTPGLPGGFMTIAMAAAVFMFLIPFGCGIWWLILFTRKSVRLQFAGAPQNAVLAAPVTMGVTEVAAGIAPRTPIPRIPVSILVIAVYFLAHGALAPFALANPLIRRMPMMLFGRVFVGGMGWVYMLAFGIVVLILGVGLLMRKEWAWVSSCVYCVFIIANGVATAFRPQVFDQIVGILRQVMPELAQLSMAVPGMRAMFYGGMVFGIGLPIAALYFLWTRREAYRAACKARP